MWFVLERGKIYAGDGRTLLATNVRKRVDGRTLYFVSDRPAEGLEPNRFHAWSADRIATGWTNLHPLRGPVNEKGNTEFVSFAASGNLYFTSDRSGSSFDVYRSRLVNGQYQPAESLGPAVNDGRYTIEAYVAPDESFILLGSFARQGPLLVD